MVQELPRILTVATARALGISRAARRHRIERGRWTALAHGLVLTAPGPPTRDDWVLGGLALAGPRAAISGWDAARTYGVGARVPPGGVLVLARAGRHRRIGEVVIRPTARPYRSSLLPSEHPSLAFAPVVQAPRAVVDAAMQHRTLNAVRALVTGSVQRGVCTPPELADEFATVPRNGSALLRRTLRDVFDGAHSVAEAEAVDTLRVAPVPAFEVNVSIETRDGVLLAVVDLLWRRLRAVLEIDSREFHFGEEAWQASLARHNLLSRYSLIVTHYSPAAVRTGGRAWSDEVAEWLRARAAELGVPYVPGGGVLRAGPDGPPKLVVASPPRRP